MNKSDELSLEQEFKLASYRKQLKQFIKTNDDKRQYY